MGAARALGAFSRLAVVTVTALAGAGVVLAWLNVRSFDALISTTYGRTLLVKLGLAAAVVAVGAYNRRVLVPALTSAAVEARQLVTVGVPGAVPHRTETSQDPRWRRLFANVRWELAGLALVLVVTAALVNIQPAAEAAGNTGAFSTFAPLGDDGSQLNLVVDPNRAGTNQVHVYLLDAAGRPASLGEHAVFRFSLPERDIGPIEREPLLIGTGHYVHTGNELALPGTWRIEIVVHLSTFEDADATVDVTVSP